MRGAISRVLSNDSRFELVGEARDGREAVECAASLRPDVVTMDFNMPGLDGAQATRAILARQPTAIVMVSAHTTQGARETVEALAAGAVDFVTKPDGEVSPNLSEIREPLIQKLLTAAGANLEPMCAAPSSDDRSDSIPRSRRAEQAAVRAMPPGLRVVGIASSTGGPAALARLLPSLRLERQGALLIIQHMPAGYTRALAEQLAEQTVFPVREANHGDTIEPGVGLVAPGDQHLVVDRSGRIALDRSPAVHGVRPAADVTFNSLAVAYGARAVGVVLTGMGRDGALGLSAIKAAGGRTVAQDRGSSTVYGMPRAAVEMGVVDEVVSLDRLGRAVTRLIG